MYISTILHLGNENKTQQYSSSQNYSTHILINLQMPENIN